MSYLIDTNVLSELKRTQPSAAVVSWMAARPAATLHLSVLTLGEIRKGIETLQDARRRQRLTEWLQVELPAYFSGRILAVDSAVADRWGRIQSQAGRPLPVIDALLAATAQAHDLVLVTRNERDFADLPVQLFNPWAAAR